MLGMVRYFFVCFDLNLVNGNKINIREKGGSVEI